MVMGNFVLFKVVCSGAIKSWRSLMKMKDAPRLGGTFWQYIFEWLSYTVMNFCLFCRYIINTSVP